MSSRPKNTGTWDVNTTTRNVISQNCGSILPEIIGPETEFRGVCQVSFISKNFHGPKKQEKYKSVQSVKFGACWALPFCEKCR